MFTRYQKPIFATMLIVLSSQSIFGMQDEKQADIPAAASSSSTMPVGAAHRASRIADLDAILTSTSSSEMDKQRAFETKRRLLAELDEEETQQRRSVEGWDEVAQAAVNSAANFLPRLLADRYIQEINAARTAEVQAQIRATVEAARESLDISSVRAAAENFMIMARAVAQNAAVQSMAGSLNSAAATICANLSNAGQKLAADVQNQQANATAPSNAAHNATENAEANIQNRNNEMMLKLFQTIITSEGARQFASGLQLIGMGIRDVGTTLATEIQNQQRAHAAAAANSSASSNVTANHNHTETAAPTENQNPQQADNAGSDSTNHNHC